jgi:hypothetical protein
VRVTAATRRRLHRATEFAGHRGRRLAGHRGRWLGGHRGRRLGSSRRKAVGLAALLLLIVIAVFVVVPALRHHEGITPPAQVLSTFETRTGADVVRDCGYSQRLPANPSASLWLFCDTDVYSSAARGVWRLSEIIDGSTAAEGPSTPGAVPVNLSELPTPGTSGTKAAGQDSPAPFLPAPSGLKTAAGLGCDLADHAYPASWPTGLTSDAASPSDVLISFDNYCISIAGGMFQPEGFGLAAYDPSTNKFTGQSTVFASPAAYPFAPAQVVPAQELLGSPVFSGNYLYLFGDSCAKIIMAVCIRGAGNGIYLARVSALSSAWTNPARYRWFAGRSGWTADPRNAVSVIQGATPLGVSVESFSSVGHALVLVEQVSEAGQFIAYQADRPTGPWRRLLSGTVPCTPGASFCRAIIGHPDLSTSANLLVSYFDPGARPRYHPGQRAQGHVMVASFPW